MSGQLNVPEGSTSYHAIKIIGPDGLPAVPEALRYRLMASEAATIRDWVVIPEDSTVIEISAADNTIGQDGADRYLAVEATHNGGKKITSELKYTIIDLKGVSK